MATLGVVALVLFALASGLGLGIWIGLQAKQRAYDVWFARHCYFCGTRLWNGEESQAFKSELTKNQRAHIRCWEINLFSGTEFDSKDDRNEF
jgi:hypothetical protein